MDSIGSVESKSLVKATIPEAHVFKGNESGDADLGKCLLVVPESLHPTEQVPENLSGRRGRGNVTWILL